MYSFEDHTFMICAYKESPYLEDCIKSVLRQTKTPNIRVSTSTPNDYIKNICEKYNFEMIVNHGKGDACDNFNFAITQCRTKLVTLCHQDDIYAPDYLSDCINHLNKTKQPIIYFCDNYECRDGALVKTNKLLLVKRMILAPLRLKFLWSSKWVRCVILRFGNPISCPSVCFVKENIKMPLFDSQYRAIHDYVAWLELMKLKGSFVYSSNPVVFHRIHKLSETTNTIQNNSRMKEEYEIFQKLWPRWIARKIAKSYSIAQNSNRH